MTRSHLIAALCVAATPLLAGCGSDDCRKTLTCPVGSGDTGGGGSTSVASQVGATTSSGSGGNMGTGGMGGHSPVARVERIFASGAHTCATKTDGSLWCWGANGLGQLGQGDVDTRTSPALVNLSAPVTSVGLGGSHTCAAAGDRTYCWGDNTDGQCGLGPASGTLTPVEVPGLNEPMLLRDSGSTWHSCATTISTGQAYCWGANHSGQLGLGTSGQFADEDTPQPVSGNFPVVATGGFHTCALRADGRISCWGDGGDGALGTGASGADRDAPTMIAGITGAADICSGYQYSCGLLGDGTVTCWGDLMSTNGATVGTKDVAQVQGLTGVEQLECGESHVCARLSSGSVTCWGYNMFGQLGSGSTSESAGLTTPQGLPPAQDIACGQGHTCAVTTDGGVYCWGDNFRGQLGTGDTFPHSTPTLVAPF